MTVSICTSADLPTFSSQFDTVAKKRDDPGSRAGVVAFC
jgi:hypothetical protein